MLGGFPGLRDPDAHEPELPAWVAALFQGSSGCIEIGGSDRSRLAPVPIDDEMDWDSEAGASASPLRVEPWILLRSRPNGTTAGH